MNCVWGGWSSWGSCSRSCGGGTKTRSRGHSTVASCGGAACSGPSTQSTSCNSQCCPVNCAWGGWSSWDRCSQTCGGGSQSKSRSASVTAKCGGNSCVGPSSSTQKCNTQSCPVNCRWSSWGSYGSCSATCGGGVQTRNRGVAVEAAHGGSSCTGQGTSSRSCNTQCCPVNCVWGSWSKPGTCSVSCGGGAQISTRSVAVPHKCGGRPCQGGTTSRTSCNTQCCPVNCQWGAWGEFGACSKSCGSGSQTRYRLVSVQSSCLGRDCSGSTASHQTCNVNPCPVDCRWGEWSKYASCSVSCGGGQQSRKRTVAVAEKHGGNSCPGTAVSSRPCNTQCCPVSCAWEEWSSFSSCSVSCGGGTMSRNRQIMVPAKCGGASCLGESNDTRKCNTVCCPVDCRWSTWSDYGVCSVSCGGGSNFRTRTILTEAACGGTKCTGSNRGLATCNSKPCAVNCVWSQWSDWSPCNATCGGGIKTRRRTIAAQARFGGSECSGEAQDIM